VSDAFGLIGGLLPSEYASSKAAWINAGLSGEAFDAGLGVTAAPAIPAPAPSPRQEPQSATPPALGSDLSPRQIEMAVKSLRAAGVSADKIQATLEADGLSMPEDDRTPDQIAHDREFGAGPYDPSMYSPLDWRELPQHMQGHSLEQRAEVDRDFRQFAADLRLPPQLGSRVMEHALRVGAEIRAMDPAAREAWKERGTDQIRQMYRTQEAWDEAGESIRTLLDLPGADRPLSAALKQGHLCDPWLWSTFANVSAHLVDWANARPDRPEDKKKK
jgi:hypothetical protein